MDLVFLAEPAGRWRRLAIGGAVVVVEEPAYVLPWWPAKGDFRMLKLVEDGALNSLRTFARQFIQFSVPLVCARDVGRVLVSGETEGMAVEDDINVF